MAAPTAGPAGSVPVLRIVAECGRSRARAGELRLPHGTVPCPVFMPVGTRGTAKGLTAAQLAALGCRICLGNTFHLGTRPGAELVRRAGGLHGFMDWPHNLLTDSGGFQMVSLLELSEVSEEGVRFRPPHGGEEILLSPERSVEIQEALGADIVMQLDDVVSSTTTGPRVEEAMDRSVRWLDRCLATHARLQQQQLQQQQQEQQLQQCQEQEQLQQQQQEQLQQCQQQLQQEKQQLQEKQQCQNQQKQQQQLQEKQQCQEQQQEKQLQQQKQQLLFAIVQGGLDPELRRRCIQAMTQRAVPGFAIGGLSGGEDKAQFWRTVKLSTELLPRDKPRYLMGVGYATDLVVCVALGCDMFDCVFPTRTARFGSALVPWGSLQLKNHQFSKDFRPIDADCGCPTCQRYSRAYLHALLRSNTAALHLLTLHNVAYQMKLMSSMRESIVQQRFPQFVRDFMDAMYGGRGGPPAWAREALESVGISLD